jgi:hypothetical protein
MVKTSKTQQQTEKDFDDDKVKFVQSFESRFSLEKLINFMSSEEHDFRQEAINKNKDDEAFNIDSYMKAMKIKSPEKIFPKAVKYIKENIFPAEKGNITYILNINKEGNVVPMEYNEKEMNKKLDKFGDLQNWFKRKYISEYRIETDLNQPRIFTKGDMQYLNIFNGYKFGDLKYDEVLHKKRLKDIEFIWNHIKVVLCSSNKPIFAEVQKWIRKLVAAMKKLKTTWYLKGRQGVGKSKIARLIYNILGLSNCFTVKHEKQIVGEFNGHFLGKVFAFIDDVKFTGDNFKYFGESMKTYITENSIAFRDLYKSATEFQNITTFMISGNDDVGCLNEDSKGRRYIISDVLDFVQSEEYFKRLAHLCENDEEFFKAFYFDCLKYHDPNYEETQSIKTLPMTQTKLAQIQKSLPIDVKFFKSVIDSNDLVKATKKTDLYKWFNDWAKAENFKFIPTQYDFITNIRKYPFVTIKSGKIDKMSYKDLIYIDRQLLISTFRKSGFITSADDIEGGDEMPTTTDLMTRRMELMKQLAELDKEIINSIKKPAKQIESESEDEECILFNDDSDSDDDDEIVVPVKSKNTSKDTKDDDLISSDIKLAFGELMD